MFRSVQPVENVKARFEAFVGWRATVNSLFEVPPVKMNVLEGYETMVVSYTSDVPFLMRWGKPCLIGPGSILDAHTANERISKTQLLDSVDLYARLAKSLLET